jgi:hypothetical protein
METQSSPVEITGDTAFALAVAVGCEFEIGPTRYENGKLITAIGLKQDVTVFLYPDGTISVYPRNK